VLQGGEAIETRNTTKSDEERGAKKNFIAKHDRQAQGRATTGIKKWKIKTNNRVPKKTQEDWEWGVSGNGQGPGTKKSGTKYLDKKLNTEYTTIKSTQAQLLRTKQKTCYGEGGAGGSGRRARKKKKGTTSEVLKRQKRFSGGKRPEETCRQAGEGEPRKKKGGKKGTNFGAPED